MIPNIFRDELAIVLGTGPSLREQMPAIKKSNARIFGINNTYLDVTPHVFTACDAQWWHEYGAHFRSVCPFLTAYHYDIEICKAFRLIHIEGRWGAGLSLNPEYIHYNHSSTAQALNLAVLYGCDPIYLCGFDMRYELGKPRHYFENLSADAGEYPVHLRKFSDFNKASSHSTEPKDFGLFECYDRIAEQKGLPRIINCTLNSAYQGFEFGDLQ